MERIMYPERQTLVFKNPKSSRGHRAAKRVKNLLHGWHTVDLESTSPRLEENAYDLAGKIKEGDGLIVVGGDGQLRTAAEAAKLADIKDVVIVPVRAGNSCDGARTFHNKKDVLRGNRLVDLLQRGMPVPVNTLDIVVNGQPYGTAVNYAGIGMTAYSGEAVNGDFVRNVRAKTPGSERMNWAMRGIEGAVIGATIIRHWSDDIRYMRDGKEFASTELLYANGRSLAGMLELDGDGLTQDNPKVVRYEIGSEGFVRHLPGIIRDLWKGSLASERVSTDTVMFCEDNGPIPIQIDGEHAYLEPGSVLTAEVHRASFQTLQRTA
jgi:diacylglycerol kinase family enzyme